MVSLWFKLGHLILRVWKIVCVCVLCLEAVLSLLRGYFSGKESVYLWLVWLVSHQSELPLQLERPLLTLSLVLVLPEAHLHCFLTYILYSFEVITEVTGHNRQGKNLSRIHAELQMKAWGWKNQSKKKKKENESQVFPFPFNLCWWLAFMWLHMVWFSVSALVLGFVKIPKRF